MKGARPGDSPRPGGPCSLRHYVRFVLSVAVTTVLGATRSHDDDGGTVTPGGPDGDRGRRGPRLPGDIVAALLAAGLVAAASL